MSELPHDLMESTPSERSHPNDAQAVPQIGGSNTKRRAAARNASFDSGRSKKQKKSSSDFATTVSIGALLLGLGALGASGYLYTEIEKFKAMGFDDMQARMDTFEERIESTLNMDKSLSNLQAIVADMKADLGRMNQELSEFRNRSRTNTQRIESISDTVSSMASKMNQSRNSIAPKAKSTRPQSPRASSASAVRSTSMVRVLSLRSVGSMTVVRLGSDQGSQSPLLTQGDTWNGWRFAGTKNGKAMLVKNGKTYEVNL